MGMKLSAAVVIPVYNHAATLEAVVGKALALEMPVIVVNDGSDVFGLNLDSPNLSVIHHPRNLGKGAAILSGIRKAREIGCDYVVTVDADGQHDPAEVPKLLEHADTRSIVIGCRRFEENVPSGSKFGRQFSNFWVAVETGRWLRDTQSGLRGYPADVADLPLKKVRYDFEIEVLVKHLWRGGCVKEAAVGVYYPAPQERISHFDQFRDNVRLSLLHTALTFQRYFLFRGWRYRCKS